MQNITKDYIFSLGLNQKIIDEALNICNTDNFDNYKKTENSDLYFAEFYYNKDNNKTYKVSIDFFNHSIDNNPIFRCNCHSNTIPCKHSIALLFEIANNKNFKISDIPIDIAKKRNIINKQSEISKNENEVNSLNSSKSIKKLNTKDKMKRQLKELIVMDSYINILLEQGIFAVESSYISTFRYISKELIKNDLLIFENYINELIFHLDIVRKHKDNYYYLKITHLLVKINLYSSKCKNYLSTAIKNNDEKYDVNFYEALGGNWTFEELDDLNLKTENAILFPLGLYTDKLSSSKKYIDIHYYFNIETKKITYTENIRSIKAKKYDKKDNYHYNLLEIDNLYSYPENYRNKIAFKSYKYANLSDNYFNMIQSFAKDITYYVIAFKKYQKKLFSKYSLPVLISYQKIGIDKYNKLFLLDKKNNQINLSNYNNSDIEKNIKLKNLTTLYDKTLYENQVLFAEIYYNYEENNIFLLPISIISNTEIIYL